ncbi:hypothetical protein EBZ80_13960 [bacterium]|nr:hypothetical protein [bacterium]
MNDLIFSNRSSSIMNDTSIFRDTMPVVHRKENSTSGFRRSIRGEEKRGDKGTDKRPSKKKTMKWWSRETKDAFEPDDDAWEDYKVQTTAPSGVYHEYVLEKYFIDDYWKHIIKQNKKEMEEEREWHRKEREYGQNGWGNDYHDDLCTYPHFCCGRMHECW